MNPNPRVNMIYKILKQCTPKDVEEVSAACHAMLKMVDEQPKQVVWVRNTGFHFYRCDESGNIISECVPWMSIEGIKILYDGLAEVRVREMPEPVKLNRCSCDKCLALRRAKPEPQHEWVIRVDKSFIGEEYYLRRDGKVGTFATFRQALASSNPGFLEINDDEEFPFYFHCKRTDTPYFGVRLLTVGEIEAAPDILRTCEVYTGAFKQGKMIKGTICGHCNIEMASRTSVQLTLDKLTPATEAVKLEDLKTIDDLQPG